MNYFEHFNVARARWLKHYDECAAELGLDPDMQERRWADEAWQECEQIHEEAIGYSQEEAS